VEEHKSTIGEEGARSNVGEEEGGRSTVGDEEGARSTVSVKEEARSTTGASEDKDIGATGSGPWSPCLSPQSLHGAKEARNTHECDARSTVR